MHSHIVAPEATTISAALVSSAVPTTTTTTSSSGEDEYEFYDAQEAPFSCRTSFGSLGSSEFLPPRKHNNNDEYVQDSIPHYEILDHDHTDNCDILPSSKTVKYFPIPLAESNNNQNDNNNITPRTITTGVLHHHVSLKDEKEKKTTEDKQNTILTTTESSSREQNNLFQQQDKLQHFKIKKQQFESNDENERNYDSKPANSDTSLLSHKTNASIYKNTVRGDCADINTMLLKNKRTNALRYLRERKTAIITGHDDSRRRWHARRSLSEGLEPISYVLASKGENESGRKDNKCNYDMQQTNEPTFLRQTEHDYANDDYYINCSANSHTMKSSKSSSTLPVVTTTSSSENNAVDLLSCDIATETSTYQNNAGTASLTTATQQHHLWSLEPKQLLEDKAAATLALATAHDTLSERFGTGEDNDQPSAALSLPSSSSSSISCSIPSSIASLSALTQHEPQQIALFPQGPITSISCQSLPHNIAKTSCDDKLQKDTNDVNSETIQFRNLDTGEVRHVPLESVTSATEKHENFFAEVFFESGYKKLQRRLEKCKNNDDGEIFSDNSSSDSEGACTSRTTGSNNPPTSGKFRALFSRARLIGQKRTQPSTAINNTSPDLQEDLASDKPVRRLFSRIRNKPQTVEPQSADSLPRDDIGISAQDNSLKLNEHHQLESSVTRDQQQSHYSPRSTNRISSSTTTQSNSVTEQRVWYQAFRRSAPPTRLPYRVPTRNDGNKDQTCLSDLWLVQEMQTPEQLPIWSLSISPDGIWLAAGSQNGTLSLWASQSLLSLKESQEQQRSTSSVIHNNGGGPLSSYESVDLTTSGLEDDVKSLSASLIQTETDENQQSTASTSLLATPYAAIVFDKSPNLTLLGHTATIVICQWDSSSLPGGVNRLASASLDRTVRVWTIEPCTKLSSVSPSRFKHTSLILHCADWSTAVCFHPLSRDLLYTGALDGTIQVWRIPLVYGDDKECDNIIARDHCQNNNISENERITQWNNGQSLFKLRRVEMLEFMRMTELVTAMAISPNGRLLSVGLRSGRVSVYEARTLRFCTEVDCRNRKGKYSNGRKVTGLHWTSDNSAICVSTSDSRLRIIPLNDVSNWLKFKGHTNNQMMLYAQFSSSEQHIICGSESSWVFVWNVHPSSLKNPLVSTRFALGKKKKPTNAQAEKFKAFNELLTSCVPGNKPFELATANLILQHKAPCNSPWIELQQALRSNYHTKTSKILSGSLYGLVVITGSYKGCIRIFINASPPVQYTS